MKVTVVSDAVYPWHTGGKEVRYNELVRGLASRGHALEVATMNWWGSARPSGVRHRALMRRVDLYVDGKRSIKQGLLFALACLRLLRDDSDVIEADHMPYLQLFPLWFVAKIRRVPLTVTWHEYWGEQGWREYLGGPAGFVAAFIEKMATRLPTHIIAVSAATLAGLRSAGVAEDRVTLAENGVAAHASVRSRSGMIAVGRLIEHKRFDVAIRAAAELKRSGRPEILHVVGEGPERANLERLVSDLDVADIVRFHGNLDSQTELWDMVAAARVVLAPSEREGYGLAVAEALQLGTPVVVSDHPENAAKDLVNNENGRIAAAGDPSAFALAATEASALDPSTVRAASAGTLASWSAMVDCYVGIYRALVPPPAGDAPSPAAPEDSRTFAQDRAVEGRALDVPADSDVPPRLSVVVCSYNGAGRIAETLRALQGQRTGSRWELLVVDDGSTDSTADVVRSMGVRVVSEGGNRGLSAARNSGIAASRGEIVAFTDDDVVPPADWVENMLAAWDDTDDDVTGIGGVTVALADDSLARRYVSVNNPLLPLEKGTGNGGIFRRLAEYLRRPDPCGHRRSVSSLVGANMSFRREALATVDGFDPVIRFGGDEEDLCRRLRAAYGEDTLEVEPALVVAHDFDRTLKDTLRRSRAYGKGNGRDWARRGGVPAVRPLPFLLAALIALVPAAPVLASVLAVALPSVVYRKVLRRGYETYGKEAVLYPYLGLLQEVHAVIGFATEAWRHKRGNRTPRQQSTFVGAVSPERLRPSLFPILAAVSVASMLFPVHWSAQAAAVFGAVLLPGAAISHLLGTDRSGRPVSLVLAAGYGVALLMLVGWFSSTLLRSAAYDRLTQVGVYGMLLATLVFVERIRDTDLLAGVLAGRPRRALVGFAAALVLPLTTLVAVERLDRGNGSGPALATFLLAAAVLVVSVAVGVSRRGARRPGAVLLGLYCAGLSVVWGTASRGQHLYGWDIQKEYSVATETITRGFWLPPTDRDAYASMLSITSIPAQFRALAGLSVETSFSLLYPMLLALLPVAAFELVRRFASVRAATVVTAGYVIGARTFPGQMPAIGRQEVALLLFVAGVLAATDSTVATPRRRLGAAALLGATAFSHYTTAYVTLFMVVVATAVTWFFTREDRQARRRATFDPKTALAIATIVLGWNLVVAPTASLIENTRQEVASDGLRVLSGQRQDQGIVQTWLEGGSAVRYGTPDEYARELSMLRDNRLAWMTADVRLGEVEPVRTSAPRAPGLLAVLRGPWTALTIIVGQLMVLVLAVGAVRSLIRRRRRADGLPADIVGLVAGAFALSVVLRISGSAAAFYNPERGALHGALVLAVPVAVLLDRLATRRVRTFLAASLAAMTFAAGTWGVAPYIVGGVPPASTAEYGEDSERFLVSPAELSAARWLATELDDTAFVQGDRYAQVVLLNVDRQSEHGKVFVLHPDFVDYRAYVFATRANVIEGRARGYENGLFAIFTSPVEEFARIRATVYANDETFVLK